MPGKFAFTARSSCKPAGVPGFDVLLGGALFILQSPTEVTMIFSGNAEARHIRLNASHSANPKPSWYGESVGHYEGDTLVVDTIGLNDKTFLDNYRTPHTDKLHVTERWRLIEDGKKLEILMTIDDPDTFNQPWQALRQYDRVNRTLSEDICSENNIQPVRHRLRHAGGGEARFLRHAPARPQGLLRSIRSSSSGRLEPRDVRKGTIAKLIRGADPGLGHQPCIVASDLSLRLR